MFIIKVQKVLSTETRTSKSGNVYQLHKILVDNPYYDGSTVYPSSKIVFASSSADFKFSHKDGKSNFCFVTINRSQSLWIQAMAM